MDINQEKFEELPQLDRIEFRQRRDLLEKQYPFLLGIAFWIIFIAFGFLLLMDIWSFVTVGETIVDFTGFSSSCIVGVILLGVLQLLLSIYKSKKIQELEGKFFEIKLKGKSK